MYSLISVKHFIFPTCIQHWCKENVSGPRPRGRQWHATCTLSPLLLLVSGGWGGSDVEHLGDSWIFNLATKKWKEVHRSAWSHKDG